MTSPLPPLDDCPVAVKPLEDNRCGYCKEHGFQHPNLCEDCRAAPVAAGSDEVGASIVQMLTVLEAPTGRHGTSSEDSWESFDPIRLQAAKCINLLLSTLTADKAEIARLRDELNVQQMQNSIATEYLIAARADRDSHQRLAIASESRCAALMAERDGMAVENKQMQDLLLMATTFRLSADIEVVSRGVSQWAVSDGGFVLNAAGEWVREPLPSNRTDEFIAQTRFKFADAITRARIALEAQERTA